MRLNIQDGGSRPWYLRLGMKAMRWKMGFMPGPILAMTYRPEMVVKQVREYILRGTNDSGPWNKGQSELFAAFVSKLNTCNF